LLLLMDTPFTLLKVTYLRKDFPGRDIRWDETGHVILNIRDDHNLHFSWKDVTGLLLSYRKPPTSCFDLVIETKAPVTHRPKNPQKKDRNIPFLTLTFETKHMQHFEQAFFDFSLNKLLETEIPSMLIQRPYDKHYSKDVRNFAVLVSHSLEVILTLCMVIHLWGAMPDAVHNFAEYLRVLMVSWTLEPCYHFFSYLYETNPTLFYWVSAGASLFMWPVAVLWMSWILIGVGLANFSVFLYVLLIFATYAPRLISNMKKIIALIPVVYGVIKKMGSKAEEKKKKKKKEEEKEGKEGKEKEA